MAEADTARPALSAFAEAAYNAEATPAQLRDALTPAELFFVRNNGRLPDAPADPDGWTLEIGGFVQRPSRFTLAELRQRFEPVTVTAVLECAGNGRAFFDPPTDGVPWHYGAVGCARWHGFRLGDLLAACGIRPEAVYTAHHSNDVALKGEGPALSRGLPLAKALAPETLLAFGMNEGPLPLLNGGPLRVVAPGFPGSAWQKWLTRLDLREREHDGAKMTGTDYRLPRRPLLPGEPLDSAIFDVIIDMPVKSLLTDPLDGFTLPAGRPVIVAGKAWSGHVPVERVEIVVEPGETRIVATLEPGDGPFAWRAFHALLPPRGPGPLAISAVASDREGRSQPLGSASWNPRGYCNNRAHRVAGRLS